MKLEIANQMTMQQLCDYSIQKLVEQGERCGFAKNPTIKGDFVCAYGLDKKHCGIGWMLDEEDSALMNLLGGVKSIITQFPESVPAAIKDNLGCAVEFQFFHDEPSQSGREGWLHILQKKYKLDTSNPAYQQWVDMGDEE